MNNEDIAIKLTKLEENQDDISEKLDRLTVLMTGNGDPEKGWTVRFDRVEQWWITYTKRKNRVGLAAFTAVLGFVGSLTLFIIRLVWGL
jgi:hypothetical protein